MNDASKTRALRGPREREWVKGEDLDMGRGPDPIGPGVRTFEIGDGDANEILAIAGPQRGLRGTTRSR